MGTIYFLSVTLHVLAALHWLGGMFFLALVGAPAIRSLDSPELRRTLFRRIGERARTSGWVSIGILFATGAINLWLRGLLWRAFDPASDFWSTSIGRAFAWKLAAVGIMVGISAIHDFVLGPMASRDGLPPEQRERVRSWTALLGRVNAVVGIVLVYWAVRLARGG